MATDQLHRMFEALRQFAWLYCYILVHLPVPRPFWCWLFQVHLVWRLPKLFQIHLAECCFRLSCHLIRSHAFFFLWNISVSMPARFLNQNMNILTMAKHRSRPRFRFSGWEYSPGCRFVTRFARLVVFWPVSEDNFCFFCLCTATVVCSSTERSLRREVTSYNVG